MSISVRYVGPCTDGVDIPISSLTSLSFPHGEWRDAPETLVNGTDAVTEEIDGETVVVVPAVAGLLAQNDGDTVMWEVAVSKPRKPRVADGT